MKEGVYVLKLTLVGRCDGKEELCRKINKWVKENTHWVRKKLAKSR